MTTPTTTYVKSGETTEWDDILIKKGIRTKDEVLLGKGLNPDDVRWCISISINNLSYASLHDIYIYPTLSCHAIPCPDYLVICIVHLCLCLCLCLSQFREKPAEIEIEAPTRDELLAEATLEEFDELEDGLSDDRMLEIYRQQRIDQMKKDRLANRFGDYNEIKKADWIPEVCVVAMLLCSMLHLMLWYMLYFL
jgi:hypothetical protein